MWPKPKEHPSLCAPVWVGIRPPCVIPACLLQGIHLPFGHTRSLWRVSIRKEPKMDARLKMSGMTDFFVISSVQIRTSLQERFRFRTKSALNLDSLSSQKLNKIQYLHFIFTGDPEKREGTEFALNITSFRQLSRTSLSPPLYLATP